MAENHEVCVTPGSREPAPVRAHRTSDGTTVVSLYGELDLLTATGLRERLDALTARPHPDLVLDLRPTTFVDCAGLGVLCRARNRVLARAGRLRLVTDSAEFLRLLRLTGLRDVFALLPRLPVPGTVVEPPEIRRAS
ncbi:STAS domain-containing protein [Streptomyces sp. AGS-58]|uniref:STAS domain-containing protein n=1 Tax=unclassified Streptomyces TaxID=2593676 RepID=UPI0035A2F3D4